MLNCFAARLNGQLGSCREAGSYVDLAGCSDGGTKVCGATARAAKSARAWRGDAEIKIWAWELSFAGQSRDRKGAAER